MLGLSPNVDGDDVLTIGVPLPVHLKNKGKIKEALVAIDMHRENTPHQSTLTFGKIEQNKFRNTSEAVEQLKWFEIPRDNQRFAWRKEMKNVFYNNQSFDDGYVNFAVFDSFFGGIHLPNSEWKPLFESILRNLTSNGKDYLKCDLETRHYCYYQGRCATHKDDFRSFHFNWVDDRGYEVAPD